MSELTARAKELAEKMGGELFGEVPKSAAIGELYGFPSLVPIKLIEQALLAERQSALIEAADICDRYSGEKWKGYKTGNSPDRGNLNAEGQSDGASHCATLILRAGKLATPRGGE